jgi:GT2 family glycosyltransferase
MSSSAPSSQDAPPSIPAVYGGDARPAISVVIPTFEPGAFLIETLHSVLEQDLGEVQMQVVMVDDGSKRTNLKELLTGIEYAGRVEIREHPDTLGLAGNWNRAIGYARGEFIHILHQDDIVAPSFYRTLLEGLRRSSRIAMGFSRHAFIDERGRTERISHRERWRAGVLNNWLERISERQRLQCPAAIVRRDAYESLGGFRADLRYALDWEMWVRIAAKYDVWYEPRVLASYRRHGATETARLQAAGATTADTLLAIAAMSVHLPTQRRARLQRRAYSCVARTHTRRAFKLVKQGFPKLAQTHIEAARYAFEFLPQSLEKSWLQARLTLAQRRLVNLELHANS